MNFEGLAAESDAPEGDAVLQAVEVGREEKRFIAAHRGETGHRVSKTRWTKQPRAIAARNFKERAIGPDVGQLRELLAKLRFTLRGKVGEQAGKGLQIRARCIVDGGFDAALKTQVANPEERSEGQRQNQRV